MSALVALGKTVFEFESCSPLKSGLSKRVALGRSPIKTSLVCVTSRDFSIFKRSVPSITDGTCVNGYRKYKRQATVNFKSDTFAEYEEFKRTMKNMSKVLDWMIVNLVKKFS